MHASMKRVHDDVAKYGWHVVAVVPRPDESFPPFAFTVGLFETYQHPELIVFCLPMKIAHAVFSTCVERIEEGATFVDGQVRSDVLNKYRAAFSTVDPSFYSEYLGTAIGFYDHLDFPVLQLVWPDRNDHFPWEPHCDANFAEEQPVLSRRTY
jgi:hypothetical protein